MAISAVLPAAGRGFAKGLDPLLGVRGQSPCHPRRTRLCTVGLCLHKPPGGVRKGARPKKAHRSEQRSSLQRLRWGASRREGLPKPQLDAQPGIEPLSLAREAWVCKGSRPFAGGAGAKPLPPEENALCTCGALPHAPQGSTPQKGPPLRAKIVATAPSLGRVRMIILTPCEGAEAKSLPS